MKKINQKLKSKSGITLIEVMVSMFILTFAILGALSYFTTAAAATQLAGEMTIATSHAEHILEDMRARSTLADITSADWGAYVTDNNLDTLDNESITVTFADAGADPLNITVAVNWDTATRTHNISLTTEMTK